VNRLLNTLSNLRCDTFIEDRAKEEFTTPVFNIQLQGSQEYSLSIFAKIEEKETQHPAISSASKYAFLLTDSQAQGIMKDSSAILKEPEPDEKASDPEEPGSKPEKE